MANDWRVMIGKSSARQPIISGMLRQKIQWRHAQNVGSMV